LKGGFLEELKRDRILEKFENWALFLRLLPKRRRIKTIENPTPKPSRKTTRKT